jgi:hypothetical protein
MELELEALEMFGDEGSLTGDNCWDTVCEILSLCDGPPVQLN